MSPPHKSSPCLPAQDLCWFLWRLTLLSFAGSQQQQDAQLLPFYLVNILKLLGPPRWSSTLSVLLLLCFIAFCIHNVISSTRKSHSTNHPAEHLSVVRYLNSLFLSDLMNIEHYSTVWDLQPTIWATPRSTLPSYIALHFSIAHVS